MITRNDISIRTTLRPGDIGYIIHMHGRIYKQEYNYGIAFETYVAAGLHEFYQQYNPVKDGVWICEHDNRIIGFLLLVHRGEAAQLRYFILEPGYRGIGLGDTLMQLFMAHLKHHNYTSAYLWTTDELTAAAHLYMKYGFRLTEEKASEAFGKPVKEQRYDFHPNNPQ
jgi:N-acetylglutamate synthase-like GNAT family acetyltransferase